MKLERWAVIGISGRMRDNVLQYVSYVYLGVVREIVANLLHNCLPSEVQFENNLKRLKKYSVTGYYSLQEFR